MERVESFDFISRNCCGAVFRSPFPKTNVRGYLNQPIAGVAGISCFNAAHVCSGAACFAGSCRSFAGIGDSLGAGCQQSQQNAREKQQSIILEIVLLEEAFL